MELRIKEATSIQDILSWVGSEPTQVVFKISRQSSFQLAADCIVPAVLSELLKRRVDITLKLEFDLPTEDSVPDFFRSLGGYSFAYNARSALDRNGIEIIDQLLHLLWRRIAVPSRGVIGDGKRLCLVSREPDSPVPSALRSDDRTVTPSRQDFQSALRRLGKEIGVEGHFRGFAGDFMTSSNEGQVATFLYEAFRNVQDHVMPGVSGIWGTTVEKLILASEAQIQTQARIPDIMRTYLCAAWRRKVTSKPLFMVSMSVCDYGPGIQNTLPKSGKENERDTILRAFERGVSRKPKSGSPNWGQGLPNIADAANRLGAFLSVYSAGLLLVKDCHVAESDWQTIVINNNGTATTGGTAISIAWPVLDESPDQEWLPLFAA